MDSMLIWSNIAVSSRYEILHNTLAIFYKSLEESRIERIGKKLRVQLDEIAGEESQKVVYRSTLEQINKKIQVLLSRLWKILRNSPVNLLKKYMLTGHINYRKMT